MTKKRKNNSYDEAFRQEAVRLALESGKPKSQVAHDLGIAQSLLYSWIAKYDEAASKGLSVEEYQAEKDELKRLQRENKRLQDEIDLLKKASAYFAKHQK